MKHILKNISQNEKHRILEQHSGGITIDNKKFVKLFEHKLGTVKTLLSEGVEPNAGAIQQFLKDNIPDPNLVVDYAFGNGTATAFGKYIAKVYPSEATLWNVTNVTQLWQVMKDKKWDVGETPGFGPKMAAAAAKLLDKVAAEAAKPKEVKKAKYKNWTADKNYLMSDPYSTDYTLNKGSVLYGMSTFGPSNWAISENQPWDTADPLVFDCKGITMSRDNQSYKFYEPEGSGTFVWSNPRGWGGNFKIYQNSELEGKLVEYFCKP